MFRRNQDSSKVKVANFQDLLSEAKEKYGKLLDATIAGLRKNDSPQDDLAKEAPSSVNLPTRNDLGELCEAFLKALVQAKIVQTPESNAGLEKDRVHFSYAGLTEEYTHIAEQQLYESVIKPFMDHVKQGSSVREAVPIVNKAIANLGVKDDRVQVIFSELSEKALKKTRDFEDFAQKEGVGRIRNVAKIAKHAKNKHHYRDYIILKNAYDLDAMREADLFCKDVIDSVRKHDGWHPILKWKLNRLKSKGEGYQATWVSLANEMIGIVKQNKQLSEVLKDKINEYASVQFLRSRSTQYCSTLVYPNHEYDLSYKASKASTQINIASINVQAFPRFLFSLRTAKPTKRLRALAKRQELKNQDVVAVQELFDTKDRELFTREMAKRGFVYSSKPLKPSRIFLNSGLMVYSKHPIVCQENLLYKNSAAEDALAKKGAMKITINKAGELYEITNTHTQAVYLNRGDAKKATYLETLEKQIKELIDFFKSKSSDNQKAPEPTKILVGDVNFPADCAAMQTNGHSTAEDFTQYKAADADYTKIKALFTGNQLKRMLLRDSHPFSFDKNANSLLKLKKEKERPSLLDHAYVEESLDAQVRSKVTNPKCFMLSGKEQTHLSDHFLVFSEVRKTLANCNEAADPASQGSLDPQPNSSSQK